MHDVRATLGDDADVAAERSPQLGLASRGHDLKLIHRIDAIRDAAQASRVVVRGQTIDDEVVRKIALAADRNALARNGRRLGKELSAPDVGRRHAWHEERQVQEVASVEGQVLHLCLRDRSRDLAARGLEHGRLPGDGDGGIEVSDLERDGQLEGGADRERERARDIGKSVEADRDFIGTDAASMANGSVLPRSVTTSRVRLVSVWRAMTCAPGTTAPWGSVTRPLTLA